MRPEQAAFKELEVLVRNLGDQLAGFRRRALSAEGRCRSLETEVAAVRDERDRMKQAIERLERENTELRLRPEPATTEAGPDEPASPELVRENAELKDLLGQAQERTTALVERVRFLRQQLTVEK